MVTVKPIIVGGTNGLGLELAKLAASEDQHPLVMGRHRPESHLAFDISWHPLDLRFDDSIDDAVQNLANSGRLYTATHLVLSAGVGYQGRLIDQRPHTIDTILQVLVSGPLKFMREFIRLRDSEPLHLVTICSTTASKVRANETAYAAAKAGQAQMARGLHQELLRDLPGSKSTLVHPGGMATDFYRGSDTDTSEFMDPSVAAKPIWEKVQAQTSDWLEFSIPRASQPRVVPGTPMVEFPKF